MQGRNDTELHMCVRLRAAVSCVKPLSQTGKFPCAESSEISHSVFSDTGAGLCLFFDSLFLLVFEKTPKLQYFAKVKNSDLLLQLVYI